MEKIEIAKRLIIEADEVGHREMAIRRTNIGTAGTIATKVSNRTKFSENLTPLTIEEQAVLLSSWLTEEECNYAENW